MRTVIKIWCLLSHSQDTDFDSQSQSSYDKALSERGPSQMSSEDTWKCKSITSEYLVLIMSLKNCYVKGMTSFAVWSLSTIVYCK